MSYPISVVVPTKNRYKYLKSLIELIIGFETDELELVIQDNSDNNQEFEEWLASKKYPWLKYYYCSDKLTSIQNFDFAINNSTGDYVTFIGDDDGVTRTIIECSKWMKKNNVEALRSAKSIYNWMESGMGGVLYSERLSKKVEYINPIKELQKILRNGCQGIDNIPVTYVGIVKKKVLSKIYKDYGTYFPGGASADIANGVALCFYVKRYIKINIPIVITGDSKCTGGVADRAKPLKFSDVPFMAKAYGEQWEGDLPKYWLGVIVWPESAIKSLRALKKEEFITYINYNKIIASSIIKAGSKFSVFYQYGSSSFAIWNEILGIKLKRYYRGVMKRLVQFLSLGKYSYKNYRFSEVRDIIKAEEKLLSITDIDFNKLEY